ncbi:acyl-CoA carboxylase subunit epsilon [Pseudokineococcus basanitobsidens]|uniref:Acyl-CoA carboxylase subunit epsilon n=1 Tax=Pseudokineococcus basanitobsidens TaxID=1926649 RepID=A0ABU8RLA8_9ACTN
MTGAEGGPPQGPDDAPRRPLLRVVRGAPDDAELAALVAVVTARPAAPAPAGPPAPTSRWGDPGHHLGVVVPGPDVWRTSGWGRR